MKTYAIIGAAGYIAPRHMRAIHDTGGKIVAACDTSDSVGILDSFGYDIPFSTNEKNFWCYLDKRKPDYVVICTPNHTHAAIVGSAMGLGADVICEKPLALSISALNVMQTLEAASGRTVHPVLQLRYHPAVKEIRSRMVDHVTRPIDRAQVHLAYHTPRGPWYDASWKGDDKRSGGLLFNIGIHMFDFLLHLFGEVKQIGHAEYDKHSACGNLHFRYAHVDWGLRIQPPDLSYSDGGPARVLLLNGHAIDFTSGFTDLHTTVYQEILAGRGLTSEDTRPAIQLVEDLKAKCTAGGP